MDKKKHGPSRRDLQMPMSPEGGGSTSSEDDTTVDKEMGLEYKTPHRSSTPKLSDSMEALAAVEAMSSFRNLKDVKKQFSTEEHSFNKEDEGRDKKKQRVADGAPGESMEVQDESKKKEWKQQWDAFVEEKKKNKYKEVAIQSLVLPLSVEEFYHHVLEDNATHSIGQFMVDIGELNVDATPWQPAHKPTAMEPTTRIIQYTHPVNAPMAPPKAKARKQQFLRKFGSVGLCLETTTSVEEVPMADCFVVDDRLWISGDDENGGCIVAVTFQIRFIKGTMFRRIIENQTRKEYESFWNQFADMIQSFKSPSALEEEELEEVAIELEEATAMLEGEGQEVPLRAVLSRIRNSSRRLSGVAMLSPTKKKIVHVESVQERPGIDVQRVMMFVLDGIGYLRKQLSESDNGAFAVACIVIFFMILLNLLALKQMMMMNRFLYDLGARLDKANELNEEFLVKLASGNADGAASLS
ncbi:hypothetical protein ACHAXR_007615 [Thalassiosira sp. AJA248-18]